MGEESDKLAKEIIKLKMDLFILENENLYSTSDFEIAKGKYYDYIFEKYFPEWEDELENINKRNLDSYLKDLK